MSKKLRVLPRGMEGMCFHEREAEEDDNKSAVWPRSWCNCSFVTIVGCLPLTSTHIAMTQATKNSAGSTTSFWQEYTRARAQYKSRREQSSGIII